MKLLLLTTIAAVVMVGCATTKSQEKIPKVESPSDLWRNCQTPPQTWRQGV
ncbi:hypothetical protein OAL38_00265 [bacterium]|nr:hypothetical protein [bacterium]MDC0308856.1 hypothetical protein [bacterium]